MSDEMVIEGAECCILEICCGSEAQDKSLSEKIEAGTTLNKHQAYEAAEWILDHYDLAPHGSLVQFKRTIAKLARTYPGMPGYE